MNGMFVKLFTQILDSSIADDRRLRHFFTDLLLCADGDGNIVMTDSAIARRIGASQEEVQWGLAELQKPDPMSKTPDCEGRRIERIGDTGYGWHIINFEAYRALRDSDQMRAVTRARVQRFRDKQKSNVTETRRNGRNSKKKEIQSTEKEREPDTEKQSAAVPACVGDFELACDVSIGEGFDKPLIEAWREWQKYRQSRHSAKGKAKLPWTLQAAELSLKQVIKAQQSYGSQMVGDRIFSAIAGNWQGLNLDKLDTQPQKSNQQTLSKNYDW